MKKLAILVLASISILSQTSFADTTSDAKAALTAKGNFACPLGNQSNSPFEKSQYGNEKDKNSCAGSRNYVECLRQSTYQQK